MKTDANFRLNKSAKRILGTIKDPIIRSIYKKMAIDAQVSFDKNGYYIFKGGNDKE
jgi:beta-xylosidase